MDFLKILQNNTEINSVEKLGPCSNNFKSIYYEDIGCFRAIEDDQTFLVYMRYAKNDLIFKLNLIDFIPFSESDLGRLNEENIMIIYLCEFSWEENDIRKEEIENDHFKIIKGLKRVKHIYIPLSKWKDYRNDRNISSTKSLVNIEFENKQPDSRFILGNRAKGLFKVNKENYPLISVIMPTFNSEKTIEQSIQSVLYQNYQNFEFIIVDGLSQDNTLNLIKKYGDYIDGVISEKDINIFDAINKGTYFSKGLYSVFLGSDDLLMPFALQKIVNIINEEGTHDFIFGDGYILRLNKKMDRVNCYIKNKYFKNFKIMHPSLYIKKNAFEELGGFDIQYDISSDADFELKLITSKKSYSQIKIPMCIFREGGYSSKAKQKMKQVWKIYKKYKAINLKLIFHIIKYYIKSIINV